MLPTEKAKDHSLECLNWLWLWEVLFTVMQSSEGPALFVSLCQVGQMLQGTRLEAVEEWAGGMGRSSVVLVLRFNLVSVSLFLGNGHLLL